MAETKSPIVEDLTFVWGLSNLSEDDFNALFAEVSAIQPSPRVQVLYEGVAQDHQPLIRSLVRLATNVLPDEDELRDLLTDHIEEITELELSHISDQQVTSAVDRGFRLLNSKPIQLHVLSTSLRTAHEHTFLNASVVTDLRPIFDEDPETGDPKVVATLRRHNLVLTTTDSERNKHRHFLVLDDEDLTYLSNVLQHALARVPAIDKLSEQNNLIDLSFS